MILYRSSYFIGMEGIFVHHKMPIYGDGSKYHHSFEKVTIFYFLKNHGTLPSELTQQWILDQFKMYFLPKKWQLSIDPVSLPNDKTISHRIHVWYIYLHFP